ncbi:hypothetical protein SLEP1_g45866 [Rubroshorea leprosula]|uniref:Uncharacterized protein n=1 Tax=Rubroshorea leprosula TaxID=152421 RepID=A0AAV5LMR8_9ROSI|nr:hypothetical protein SLEP1_g45866 [Rubroshorea leprosula]
MAMAPPKMLTDINKNLNHAPHFASASLCPPASVTDCGDS